MSTVVNIQGKPAAQKIAVFRARHLGDMLCAVPALRALRNRFPRAEITMIGLPWAAELCERLDLADRFLAFPGYPDLSDVPYQPSRTEAFFAEALAKDYDLAIQMQDDCLASNSFVADLGAYVSLGYRQPYDEQLTMGLDYHADDHEILRWMRLIQLLDPKANDNRILLPVTRVETSRAVTLLRGVVPGDSPLIALHPGGRDPASRWPPERFAQLGDRLASMYGARILLTGNEDERLITGVIGRAMQAPVLDLAGATDIGTLAALFDRIDLLITNDTGVSHIAAARATNSIVLFGPSRPDQWAPLNRDLHWVVDACRLAGPSVDPALALRELTVDAVLAVCNEAIEPKKAMAVGASSNSGGLQTALHNRA